MTDPIKKKKTQANGQPIGSTQPLTRTPEQEARDARASKRLGTEEGKEAMSKIGVNVDKKKKSTPKKYEKKIIKGDRTKGTYDRVTDGSGKVIYEDNAKTVGSTKKKYDREKAMTEKSRKTSADVANMQVKGEDNAASQRSKQQTEGGYQNKVSGMQKTKIVKRKK